MKPSTIEHLDTAVKAWIAHDLPMSEKESLSPALIESLHKRFAATDPDPKPPEPPKPAPKPPEPKPAAKKLLSTAKTIFKKKTSKPKAKKKTRH